MINIAIDNYIRVSGLPRPQFDEIIRRLTYPNPQFVNALKYGQGNARWIPRTIKSYVYQDGELWLPRGYYMEFLAEIVLKSRSPYQIIDTRKEDKTNVPKGTAKLRSYQEKMIAEALVYPGPGFIMQAPPGTGKTYTGLELARQLGRKTLWITHTKELAYQTRSAAARLFGIPEKEIGIIGQGKFSIGEFLTIGMIQTIYRKKEEIAKLKYEFGTIVVDEVHHAPANSWNLATHLLAPIFTFGLTATSYRNDGLTQMMYDCMGPVVTIADKTLLLKEGVLVIPSIYMVNTDMRFSGASYASILSDIVVSRRRNSFIMELINYIRRDSQSNNTLLVLSARRSHVETITDQCHAMGLAPVKMLGEMTALERTLAAERIQSGEARLIVATYKLLSEGFDYPPINFVLFATPFKDSVLIEQCVGRAQRVAEGKNDAYILDLVDTNGILLKQSRVRHSVYAGLGMEVFSANATTFRK